MTSKDLDQIAVALECLERVQIDEGDRLSGENLSRLALAISLLRTTLQQDVVKEYAWIR